MGRENLYNLVGVAPAASRGEIEAAIKSRLVLTRDEAARDELMQAAATLLSPASRASYDRLLGLGDTLSAEGRSDWLHEEMEAIASRERQRNDAGLRAELFMTMYMTAAALIMALWVLVMIRYLPTFAPQVERLLQFYGWAEQSAIVGAILLTIPFGGAAWFLMHLFEREMEILGRFMVTCGLLVLTIVLAMQLVRSDSLVSPIAMMLVAVPLLMLSIPIIRRVGMSDLMAATGPRVRRARRRQ